MTTYIFHVTLRIIIVIIIILLVKYGYDTQLRNRGKPLEEKQNVLNLKTYKIYSKCKGGKKKIGFLYKRKENN